jgi:hypothetical protein
MENNLNVVTINNDCLYILLCVIFSLVSVLERLGIELRPPEASPAVTPQQLLQKSIEQQVQQVKSSTGIELPKYYNPAAMNPARYAEQMQKRKLLWGHKVRTWLLLVVYIAIQIFRHNKVAEMCPSSAV